MPNDHITVQIKTLAGQIMSLDVPPTSSLQEIAALCSTFDPDQFPPRRTKIIPFQEEQDQDQDQDQELQEDQLLLVLIQDGPILESGIFPQGGKEYERLIIPFRDQSIYLYMLSYRSRIEQVTHAEYAIAFSSEVSKPSETFLRQGRVLYEVIRGLFLDVTPQEMKELYDVVMPYWQDLTYRRGYLCSESGGCAGNSIAGHHGFSHTRSPKEPILCECGSIVQNNSLRTHLKSKKHRDALTS